MNRADIDGFYGEPAEFDEALEVELVMLADTSGAMVETSGAMVSVDDDDDRITAPVPRLREVALAAETISVDGLEDAWFGNFDENAPLGADTFEDEPTTTWGKIGDWLKSLGRAA